MKIVKSVAVGATLGVVIDLAAVWVWLTFIHDGPEFPY
jgi:hypothetical protein